MHLVGFGLFGFAAVVVALYSVVPPSWRKLVLLAASLGFFTVVDGRLPYVLAIPAVVDYQIVRRIASTTDRRRKRRWLALSIVVDVIVLGFFKYVHFFADEACTLLDRIGVDATSCGSALHIVMPLGISYFIFKSISTVIDVYRGKPAPASWFDYAAYLAFFPQLVAGPIERFASFGPQLVAHRRANLDDVRRGTALLLRGLFKKLVVANNIHYVGAAVLDPSNGSVVGSLDAAFAMYAYLWELYADFSGYSDIANGIAAFFGFKPVLNFNLPLFATRPSDFWRRWHVSLSSWVNDYVLFGLVGLRAQGLKLYAAVMASMLVIGIWHGPQLVFVMFGVYHGLLLVAEMYLRTGGWIGRSEPRAWRTVASIVLMFHLAVIGELLYATSSVSRAGEVVAAVFGGQLWTDRTTAIIGMFAVYVGPLAVLELFERLRPDGVAKLSPVRRGLVYSFFVAAIALFGTPGGGVLYAGF